MVFRVTMGNRTLRGLIAICQDYTREVVELFRKVVSMLEDLAKEERSSIKVKLKEVEALHRRSSEIERSLIKELNDVGELLANREDFFRLTDKLGEMADYMEGLGVIIGDAAEIGGKVPSRVKEGVVKLSEVTLQALLKFRESLLALGESSPRTLDLAKQVEELEREVDALHRKIDLEVITSKVELPLILLLRDIIQYLENTTDKIEEAAELVRILVM